MSLTPPRKNNAASCWYSFIPADASFVVLYLFRVSKGSLFKSTTAVFSCHPRTGHLSLRSLRSTQHKHSSAGALLRESNMTWWTNPDFEIPIFPLPNVVHFPGVTVPLHVFEPRYRTLVKDAVSG